MSTVDQLHNQFNLYPVPEKLRDRIEVSIYSDGYMNSVPFIKWRVTIQGRFADREVSVWLTDHGDGYQYEIYPHDEGIDRVDASMDGTSRWKQVWASIIEAANSQSQ